nr:hypothetical protein GCM10020092_043190 [Actinoplanes digitatis]
MPIRSQAVVVRTVPATRCPVMTQEMVTFWFLRTDPTIFADCEGALRTLSVAATCTVADTPRGVGGTGRYDQSGDQPG